MPPRPATCLFARPRNYNVDCLEGTARLLACSATETCAPRKARWRLERPWPPGSSSLPVAPARQRCRGCKGQVVVAESIYARRVKPCAQPVEPRACGYWQNTDATTHQGTPSRCVATECTCYEPTEIQQEEERMAATARGRRRHTRQYCRHRFRCTLARQELDP